jgi:hypothetical protein
LLAPEPLGESRLADADLRHLLGRSPVDALGRPCLGP